MSIILVLLVLFLCLSSCNGRMLGVAPNPPAPNEFQHSITKANDEKLNHFPTEVERKKAVESEEKRVQDEENDNGTDSASEKTWRVPHSSKRRSEEAAGFNLDYLPPKTHPPAHN